MIDTDQALLSTLGHFKQSQRSSVSNRAIIIQSRSSWTSRILNDLINFNLWSSLDMTVVRDDASLMGEGYLKESHLKQHFCCFDLNLGKQDAVFLCTFGIFHVPLTGMARNTWAAPSWDPQFQEIPSSLCSCEVKHKCCWVCQVCQVCHSGETLWSLV